LFDRGPAGIAESRQVLTRASRGVESGKLGGILANLLQVASSTPSRTGGNSPFLYDPRSARPNLEHDLALVNASQPATTKEGPGG
jgi:hypothetical protein